MDGKSHRNAGGAEEAQPQFAQRACAFAAQAKKQMEMQAQGGGAGAQPQVKLPAGPL